MLSLLRRREAEGDSTMRSRKGGTFSLFALPSSSSIEVRTRFTFGVDSGVGRGVEDEFDFIDEERVSALVVRFPSTDGDV